LFSAQAQQQTSEQLTALFPYQQSASVQSSLLKMDSWSSKEWRNLFKMLDDDSLKLKATYTVDAYVHYANSNAVLVPATTQQVVNGLKQVKSFYAKNYLIPMLGALGSEIGIAPLSKYLKDPVFVGPAARALAAIGSDNAKAALSSALLKAAAPQKMHINAALAHMQFKLPEMKSEDTKGRIGLVNFQDPRYLAKVQEQMEQAKDPVTKRNILSQLEKVTSVAALMETAKYLDDPVLKKQAASIMARMALRDNSLRGRGPRAVLEKALPLIGGTDSNKKGYALEDSVIVTHPELGGGNIYTAEEYSDFEFRFEFQLTPGANNGLGIRAPIKGDAAYEGMELQILDNESPIYEKLKPYQYHGSVYGVIPAKRGYLKTTGDWNEQTVVVKGTKIIVTLNGQVILDGDIKEASKNGTADGREHPGLMNTKGHIGFLGHGDVVRFRNIRIKKL